MLDAEYFSQSITNGHLLLISTLHGGAERNLPGRRLSVTGTSNPAAHNPLGRMLIADTGKEDSGAHAAASRIEHHKINCDGAQIDALLVNLFLEAHERVPAE